MGAVHVSGFSAQLHSKLLTNWQCSYTVVVVSTNIVSKLDTNLLLPGEIPPLNPSINRFSRPTV